MFPGPFRTAVSLTNLQPCWPVADYLGHICHHEQVHGSIYPWTGSICAVTDSQWEHGFMRYHRCYTHAPTLRWPISNIATQICKIAASIELNALMGRTLDRASPPHTEMSGDAKSVWAAPWNPRFLSLSLASEAKRGKHPDSDESCGSSLVTEQALFIFSSTPASGLRKSSGMKYPVFIIIGLTARRGRRRKGKRGGGERIRVWVDSLESTLLLISKK
jgi:hypothetical protein